MRAVPTTRQVQTRRTLLVGMAAVPAAMALVGCRGEPESVPVDPERLQLEAARGVERQLLQALQADPATSADATRAVEQHLVALASALGETEAAVTATSSPSPSESSTDDATPLSPVRAADRATDQHTRAMRSAAAGITPLLASIAASDAAIAAALRAGDR